MPAEALLRQVMAAEVPTPAEQQDARPALQLQQLTLQHPQAATLQAACAAIGVATGVAITPGDAPRLTAQLITPHGPVAITSLTPET